MARLSGGNIPGSRNDALNSPSDGRHPHNCFVPGTGARTARYYNKLEHQALLRPRHGASSRSGDFLDASRPNVTQRSSLIGRAPKMPRFVSTVLAISLGLGNAAFAAPSGLPKPAFEPSAATIEPIAYHGRHYGHHTYHHSYRHHHYYRRHHYHYGSSAAAAAMFGAVAAGILSNGCYYGDCGYYGYGDYGGYGGYPAYGYGGGWRHGGYYGGRGFGGFHGGGFHAGGFHGGGFHGGGFHGGGFHAGGFHGWGLPRPSLISAAPCCGKAAKPVDNPRRRRQDRARSSMASEPNSCEAI